MHVYSANINRCYVDICKFMKTKLLNLKKKTKHHCSIACAVCVAQSFLFSYVLCACTYFSINFISPAYGLYISQLILFSRNSCLQNVVQQGTTGGEVNLKVK